MGSTLSDDEGAASEDEAEGPRFSFPELDAQIRAAIREYGAVFPKLNFSSPKVRARGFLAAPETPSPVPQDAAWVLPASSPLKCTSPSDVYMLLKSSDFVAHDLSTETVFAGCDAPPPAGAYQLELVLRKWYPMDRSREMRCFVRRGNLIGKGSPDTPRASLILVQVYLRGT